MRFVILLVTVFLIFNEPVSSQIISGKIINATNNKPVQNANVFLEGTLLGTTSDKDGLFRFNSYGFTNIPLIISFVGYETIETSIGNLNKEPIVTLNKKLFEIDEIKVRSKKSGWSRSKMYRIFKEEFIGKSYNAESCKIKNKEDIYLFYNRDTKTLYASSNHPIIIENKLLGYEIRYLLKSFIKSETGIKFRGYSSFKEVEFRNAKQKKKIEEQRWNTYHGSIMHFIRYLYNENITDNDTVFDLNVLNNKLKGQELKTIEFDREQGIYVQSNSKINDFYNANFKDKFQLYDNIGNFLPIRNLVFDENNKRYIFEGKIITIKYLGTLGHSFMLPKLGNIEISESGYYNPDLIGWSGVMSKKRVGDLLPFDYQPVTK